MKLTTELINNYLMLIRKFNIKTNLFQCMYKQVKNFFIVIYRKIR